MSDERPISSRRAHSDQRRAAILHAAERLLRELGVAKTTIGGIAREAGIGVGTVYLEFESKASIVTELSQLRHDRVVRAMRETLPCGNGAGSGPPSEPGSAPPDVPVDSARDAGRAGLGAPAEPISARLEAMLEARVRAFFELAAEGAHACDFVLRKSAAAGVGHFAEQECELLTQLLAEGRASAELEFSDLELTSTLIQRSLAAYSPPWLFALAPDQAATEVRALARLLLAGLLTRAR